MRASRLLQSIKAKTHRMGPPGYVLTGLAVALVWTVLGLLLALLEGAIEPFSQEWISLQGFFLFSIGVFLLLLSSSDRLRRVAEELNLETRSLTTSRSATILIIIFVTVAGSLSLMTLGFPGTGMVLGFMLFSCFLVCFMASLATLHAAVILRVSTSLYHGEPTLYLYSPADTPGLRKFAEYVSLYGLAITVGYAFSLMGTLLGNWSADEPTIQAVQFFWPIIYVPLCLIVLSYPHLAVYKSVREKKDALLDGLQREVREVSSAHELSKDDIDRLNSLADLIQKVEAAPNYPHSLRIVGLFALTSAINIASLVIPRETLAEIIRHSVSLQ